MRHLDLFSGIGGFALATEMVWFEVEHTFVEIDPFCQVILKKHWPNSPIHGDIKTFSTKAHFDLLTGGFPCQPFSVAGKQNGKGDDRWLWPEMFRIIQEVRPTWVIGENVAGIIPMALDEVCADLENTGYEIQSFVIPAASLNAPHKRERVWIVATNTKHDGLTSSKVRQGMEAGNDHHKKGTKPGKQPQGLRCTKHAGWDVWPPRPYVRGMDDGLPDRMDRIKALGNAIVPQIAAEIMKGIKERLAN